jgi:hypothetical protein
VKRCKCTFDVNQKLVFDYTNVVFVVFINVAAVSDFILQGRNDISDVQIVFAGSILAKGID